MLLLTGTCGPQEVTPPCHIGKRKDGSFFFYFYHLVCAYPKVEITLYLRQTQEVYSGHCDTNIINWGIPVKETSNLVRYLPHRLPVNSQANDTLPHRTREQDCPRHLYHQNPASLSFKHYFCAIPDFCSSADILLLRVAQAWLLWQPN